MNTHHTTTLTEKLAYALGLYDHALDALNFIRPAFMIVIRLFIAHVFWQSGMVKISDWDATLYLFSDEYAVPLLPPAIAATVATIFELSCPVLLTLGLASRLATLPLLGMTAVINFTYQDNVEHYYWAMLLGTTLFYGPGVMSLDHLIRRFVIKKR